MMNARFLLLFHVRAGVRQGVRASAVIVAAMIGWAILQQSPTAFVVGVARAAFAARLASVDNLPLGVLAFLLPAWASGRLSPGLNGWMRHLPFTSADNRRGLALAFLAVQLPIAVILAGGALFAVRPHAPVAISAARWMLVLGAGAVASLPVERRLLTIACSAVAASSAVALPAYGLAISAMALALSDVAAGAIRTTRRHREWRTGEALVMWRMTWRAVGLRLASAYALGIVPLAAGILFLRNNGVGGAAATAAIRWAAETASVLCLFSLTKALAVRRPSWAFARSLPWSAANRVASDAVFLGVHVTPLLLALAMHSPTSVATAALAVPFLASRAAGYVPRVQDAPGLALQFLLEGLVVACIVTLVPWSVVAWLLATPGALRHAAEIERTHKVTRWSGWEFPGRAGDTSAGSAA